jgi:hypothetical protein
MRQPPTSVILALDPGLAHIGFVIARVWPGMTIWDVEVVKAGAWTAELPDIDDRMQSSVEDSFRRAQVQGRRLHETIVQEGVTVVVTEELSHPPDAGAAAKVAMFWGLLARVVDVQSLHVEMIRPQDIRRTLGLPKTTRTMTRKDKKKLVHDELERRYGVAKLKALVGHLKRAEDRSHPLDALASFTAAMVIQFGDGFTLR